MQSRRSGRHLHARLLRHRPALVSAGYAAALLAVVGPGVLAGLSEWPGDYEVLLVTGAGADCCVE